MLFLPLVWWLIFVLGGCGYAFENLIESLISSLGKKCTSTHLQEVKSPFQKSLHHFEDLDEKIFLPSYGLLGSWIHMTQPRVWHVGIQHGYLIGILIPIRIQLASIKATSDKFLMSTHWRFVSSLLPGDHFQSVQVKDFLPGRDSFWKKRWIDDTDRLCSRKESLVKGN